MKTQFNWSLLSLEWKISKYLILQNQKLFNNKSSEILRAFLFSFDVYSNDIELMNWIIYYPRLHDKLESSLYFTNVAIPFGGGCSELKGSH